MFKKTLTLASFLLAACQGSTPSAVSVSDKNQMEPIYGYTLHDDAIEFLVQSTGCTKAADFDMLELESFPVQWVLRRTHPDLCKSAPHIVSIKLAKQSIEGIILNPLRRDIKNFVCSTPVVKPLPGTADYLYMDASIEARFDASLCDGKGGIQLQGTASRTGGFAGFNDFAAIHTQVCEPARKLQYLPIKSEDSTSLFRLTKIGDHGVEKASLTIEEGQLQGSTYELNCVEPIEN